MPDFLSLADFDRAEIGDLLDTADEMQARWLRRDMPQLLAGKNVGLIRGSGGFRNALAFEIGVRALGGQIFGLAVSLDCGEPPTDMARYLDNWLDGLIVREQRFDVLVEMARTLSAPLINARTSVNHPCEILGDLQYIRRRRGAIDGLTIVVVGPVGNIVGSWTEAAAVLPIDIVQIAPPGHTINAPATGRNTVGTIRVEHELDVGLRAADVVVTDCWPRPTSDLERAEIARQFGPLRIFAKTLRLAREDVIFIPCPPVTRGQEVADDAMTSELCVSYEAKAHLLHAQNAILTHCIEV